MNIVWPRDLSRRSSAWTLAPRSTDIAQIAPLPEQPRRKTKPKRKPNKRAKARARGRAQRLAERRRFFLNLRALPDEAVLTLAEWQTLNSLSERQARRILASGDGPVVTMLSAKRKGITVRANREWQEARACGR
jgi:hypothetical protein